MHTETEPDINEQTIERYVPEHSGENFLPHLTVGMATLGDRTNIEDETFDPFPFSQPRSVSTNSATTALPPNTSQRGPRNHLPGDASMKRRMKADLAPV
ncbi:hypothetical protein BKP42_53800 [Rhodococcus erythropolis]|uniref:hypothetical protein n=1 Tax=Rhodococcus erythropolis TaxID=1833 RepID=UPI00117AD693|nr:hypothetical protein [Rhodococcus erythropolis]PBI91961.1 hypothetical protein BKP42_53800 [Rhodococcus erythropolis]